MNQFVFILCAVLGRINHNLKETGVSFHQSSTMSLGSRLKKTKSKDKKVDEVDLKILQKIHLVQVCRISITLPCLQCWLNLRKFSCYYKK